jgi:hypothetical protein
MPKLAPRLCRRWLSQRPTATQGPAACLLTQVPAHPPHAPAPVRGELCKASGCQGCALQSLHHGPLVFHGVRHKAGACNTDACACAGLSTQAAEADQRSLLPQECGPGQGGPAD